MKLEYFVTSIGDSTNVNPFLSFTVFTSVKSNIFLIKL